MLLCDRKSSLVVNELVVILKLCLDELTRASGFVAYSSDGDLWIVIASWLIKCWLMIILGEDGLLVNVEDFYGMLMSILFLCCVVGLSFLW